MLSFENLNYDNSLEELNTTFHAIYDTLKKDQHTVRSPANLKPPKLGKSFKFDHMSTRPSVERLEVEDKLFKTFLSPTAHSKSTLSSLKYLNKRPNKNHTSIDHQYMPGINVTGMSTFDHGVVNFNNQPPKSVIKI